MAEERQRRQRLEGALRTLLSICRACAVTLLRVALLPVAVNLLLTVLSFCRVSLQGMEGNRAAPQHAQRVRERHVAAVSRVYTAQGRVSHQRPHARACSAAARQ